MNRAKLEALARHLAPPGDGIATALVGLHEADGGFDCDACAVHHADMDAARAAHPGAMLVVESVVEPAPARQ